MQKTVVVEHTGITANLYWEEGGLNNGPSRSLLTSLSPLRKSQVDKKQPVAGMEQGQFPVFKGNRIVFPLHYLQLTAPSVNTQIFKKTQTKTN